MPLIFQCRISPQNFPSILAIYLTTSSGRSTSQARSQPLSVNAFRKESCKKIHYFAAETKIIFKLLKKQKPSLQQLSSATSDSSTSISYCLILCERCIIFSNLNAVAETSGLRLPFVTCCAANVAQVDAMDQI